MSVHSIEQELKASTSLSGVSDNAALPTEHSDEGLAIAVGPLHTDLLAAVTAVTETPERNEPPSFTNGDASLSGDDTVGSGSSKTQFLGLYQAGYENTMCMVKTMQRYAAARSAQDVLVVTSEFYKEQRRLFEKSAEGMLSLFQI